MEDHKFVDIDGNGYTLNFTAIPVNMLSRQYANSGVQEIVDQNRGNTFVNVFK